MATKRLCSYCDTSGHTIKTCQLKKIHFQHAEKINAESRKKTVQLMKEMGLCIGSLVELKYRNFSKLDDLSSMDDDANIGIFYVDQIRWYSINKTIIDSHIDKKLSEHMRTQGIVKSNYSNVVLINPEYPGGYSLTITLDKLQRLSRQELPFSLQNNVLGDFFIHDKGNWEETEKTIPEDFFQGKFYKSLK